MRSLMTFVAALSIAIPASCVLADEPAPPAPAAEIEEPAIESLAQPAPEITEPVAPESIEPEPIVRGGGLTIDVGRVFNFGRGVRVRIGKKQFGERDIEVQLDGNRIGHGADYRLNVRTRDMGDGDVHIQRLPKAREVYEAEKRAQDAEQDLDVELGTPAAAPELGVPALPEPSAADEKPLKAPPVDLGSDSPAYAPRVRPGDGDASSTPKNVAPPKPGATKPAAGKKAVDL